MPVDFLRFFGDLKRANAAGALFREPPALLAVFSLTQLFLLRVALPCGRVAGSCKEASVTRRRRHLLLGFGIQSRSRFCPRPRSPFLSQIP